MESRIKRVRNGVLALVALTLAPSAAPSANPLIETLIRDAAPCAGLRVDFPPVLSIGIDALQSLQVHDATITLENASLSAEIDATLYCETGPAAAAPHDLGARVTIDLDADTATCTVESVEARVSDIGGSAAESVDEFLTAFGQSEAGWRQLTVYLESTLEQAARKEAETQCRAALDRAG
jgi:hypothetical protein